MPASHNVYLPHMIETCSRLGISIVIVTAIILFGASFLIGFLPPETTVVERVSAWNCSTATTRFTPSICTGVNLLESGATWVGMLPQSSSAVLVPENQEVHLMAAPTNLRGNLYGITRIINVTIAMVGTNAGGLVTPTGEDLSYEGSHQRVIDCPVGSTRCSPVTIMSSNQFAERWLVNVSINTNLTTAEDISDWFGDIEFQWRYTNKGWVTYQLAWRYILMTLSLGALAAFLFAFWHVKGHKHADQKWVIVLDAAVVLLDNPLFALRILTVGWFWSFLDSIFSAFCMNALMCHLLVLFGGFITPVRSFWQFYLPRLVVCGLYFCLQVALLSLFEFRDPTQGFDEMPALRPVSIAATIVFVVWALWFLYTVARILVTCKKDFKRGVRKIKGRYMLLFVYIIVAVVFIVAGQAIVQTLSMSQAGASYLVMVTMANVYVWTMSVLMAPSSGQVQTHTTWKSAQNPKRGEFQAAGGDAEAGAHTTDAALTEPYGDPIVDASPVGDGTVDAAPAPAAAPAPPPLGSAPRTAAAPAEDDEL